MILEDFDFENYQGEDLIIATGAPGSKWSGLLNAVSFHNDVNDEDKADHRKYFIYYEKADTGQVLKMGWHFGVYFGPDNEYGQKFDNLKAISKEEMVREFAKPYETWDGIKIIKSHWFAYDLDTLTKYFPKAKIVVVWAPDVSCFDWWTHLGGWNITFPVYTWYKEDTRMQSKIREENAYILKFVFEKNLKISKGSIKEVCNMLGLTSDTTSFKNFDPNDLSKHVSKDSSYHADIGATGTLSQLIGSTLFAIYNPETHKDDHPVLRLIDNTFAKKTVHSIDSLIPLGKNYEV
jgi:hypothetical protein